MGMRNLKIIKRIPVFHREKQYEWLADQLKILSGPIIIVSHQPLAGPSSIDNASEVQKLISANADKVLLAINGHTHIDHVEKINEVSYLHINSASYKWVGGSYRNKVIRQKSIKNFHGLNILVHIVKVFLVP